MNRSLLLTFALTATAGCTDLVLDDAPAASLVANETPVIYGGDDRVEVEDATSEAQTAANSVVALLSNSSVSDMGDGWFQLDTSTTFGESRSLCDGEAFADQIDPAWCTGFQVGPDLIATAGHCITSDADCADTTFVFGFQTTNGVADGVVGADDVYTCAAIVDRQQSASDWAIVRVDRPIVGHGPLNVRDAGSIGATSVVVIGHPNGIPAKVAGGAQVQGNSAPEYFEANLDTFGGNSGSPVFDADFTMVEGILVRGEADFVKVGKGKRACYRVNTCSDSGCSGGGFEEVTRATEFAHLLDTTPPPTCADDSYEQNDSASDAPTISGAQTVENLQICASDADFFRVWVEAGDVLTATIAFTHADGDLNLVLESAVATTLDNSAGAGDSETVTHAPRSYAGSIYIGVTGLGNAQNGYTLTTSVETAPPPPPSTCGNGTCDDGESCDGRSGTTACGSDCPGRLSGKPHKRYCWVGATCEGGGCP